MNSSWNKMFGTEPFTDKGWLAAIVTQSLSGGYGMNATNAAMARPNFTRHVVLAGDPSHYREYNALSQVIGQNSEFYGGAIGAYWDDLACTNCLFDRTGMGVGGSNPARWWLRNCTMRGGSLTLSEYGQTWPVWIEDCAFDGTTLSVDTNGLVCDYNSYVTNDDRLPLQPGTHDVIVTNYNWLASWLGNYYLPSRVSG